LSTCSTNYPIVVFFVRDDDIPFLVKNKFVDYGIVGGNVLAESQLKIRYKKNLNFGYCKLCLGVPKKAQIKSIYDLKNCSIATSYPNITKKYFDTFGLNRTFVCMK